jgi:hypothetical protein
MVMRASLFTTSRRCSSVRQRLLPNRSIGTRYLAHLLSASLAIVTIEPLTVRGRIAMHLRPSGRHILVRP